MPAHRHLDQLDVGSPEWEARRKLQHALEEHRRMIDEYHHVKAPVAIGVTIALAVATGILAAWALRSRRDDNVLEDRR